MPPPDPVLCMLAAIVAAAAGMRWVRRHNARALSVLRRVPVSSIRAAPEGTVHLRGRVLCDGPLLEAPLSSRRCVFHDVLVEDSSDKISLRQVRGLRFRIQDDTGIAHVVFEDAGHAPAFAAGPRYVSCAISREVWEGGGLFDSLFERRVTTRTEALVYEHGLGDRLGFGFWLTGWEGVIEVGDVVDIVGSGAHRPAPGGESSGYRSPPEEYVVEAAEGAPVLVVKRGRKKIRSWG
jgi:hypothetical protein